MDKYFLNPEFENDSIITRTDDGTEILINKFNFNDYFGDLLFKNGQTHLVRINPRWINENSNEKKTFVQVSENVISLTYPVALNEESEQKEIVKNQKLEQSVGKQRKQKK
jgi:hypothetical protein